MDQYEFEQHASKAQQWMQERRWGVIIALAVVVLLVFGVWGMFFSVPPDSQGVVKRFGAVVRIEEPGLHVKIPFGVERATPVPVKRVLKEEFGFRTVQAGERSEFSKPAEIKERESLMLTGDLNVIDVEWVVQYRITDADKWLHRVRDAEETIRDVSEAVMRRVIGNHLSSEALTVARAQIAEEVRGELQRILDDPASTAPDDPYDMGIKVDAVEMQDVTPPDPVKPAFNDVNKARQERERLINQAQKERNQKIPRAEGVADQTIAQAEAYRTQRVNAARGEAARFTSILEAYQQSERVTRRRLYLEMIDEVFPRLGRIYVMEGDQPAPLPLLDLNGAVKRGGDQ